MNESSMFILRFLLLWFHESRQAISGETRGRFRLFNFSFFFRWMERNCCHQKSVITSFTQRIIELLILFVFQLIPKNIKLPILTEENGCHCILCLYLLTLKKLSCHQLSVFKFTLPITEHFIDLSWIAFNLYLEFSKYLDSPFKTSLFLAYYSDEPTNG